MVQQMNTPLKNCTSSSGPLDSSTPPLFVGPWKCNVCGEKFSDPKAHVDHMGSHTQDYPSSCQLCLSRFKNAAELSGHICAANTRSKSRTQITISTTSVKPILQNGEPKPPILRDETQFVNNAGHSHSTPLPDIDDDDYELGVALRRSRSSSIETNNNQSDQGKEFFVVDPWLACSTLIDTSEMMEMESYVTEAAINDAVGNMLTETLTKSRNIKNISLQRKKHGKNQRHSSFEAGIGRDRKLSTGSGQNSAQSAPGGQIVDELTCPRLPLSVPLNDIVANNEDMVFDEPVTEPQPIPSRYQYSSRELKCVRCNVTFPQYEDWRLHTYKEHIRIDDPNYPKVHMNYVNIAEIGGSDGPFVVSTDENGKVLIVPKPAPQLEPVIERVVEKKPTAAEEGREVLKFTFCRSEGRSYVVKRKSTDSTDTNESSSTDKQPVVETSPRAEEKNDSTSAVLSAADESPLPTPSPERDEEFNMRLEAVVEQSRIKPVSPTPTASSPKDTGESNKVTATTTSRMGFRPRFMRVMHSIKKGTIKQKIQVVGSREPVTRSQTNDETRPAVSSGPDKPSVTSAPSVISDQPLPDLVSSQERLTNSVTDENDNHRNTANSKCPVPSESSGTSSAPSLTDKELPKEQSSSPKISAVSDLKSNNNNVVATNKDLAKLTPEAPSSETSQISSSQPPVSNKVDNSNTSKENLVSGEQQVIAESVAVADDADDDDDDGALMIDVPGESEPNTAKEPRANDEDLSVHNATQDSEKSKINDNGNVTTAAVSAPESEKGATSDNDKNNPDEDKPDEEHDDDFQCRVCKQMFTCDEDLETHFSAEHFRPVGSSILEPESPFPTVTVHGISSIFEDEVEESEPISVEPAAQNTLQLLLRRSSTEEPHRPSNTAAIAPVRQQGVVAPNRMAMPYGPQIRPNMHGRGVPNARPQLQMVPPGTTAALNRPGMRPPPNMAPGPGQRGPAPVPYRANNYPYTLHQALANPQHGQVQGPPQRPQLRPMPGAHMQGGPRVLGPQPPQNRPPLTRVPPTTQMGNQQNAVVTQQQQSALMTPPTSTQHRELSMQILQHQQKLQQVGQSVSNISQALAQESNPVRINHLQAEKDKLSQLLYHYRTQLRAAQQQQQEIERQHHHQIQQQRQHQQNQIQQQQRHLQLQQHQQQQQQQQHLQRQQLQQLQLQQQQELEIRNQQQQLQQRQQQINEARTHHANSNGKRPAIEVFDVTHGNRAKQPRIDFGQPEETTITEVNQSTHKNPPTDNRTLRIPNGLSLSIVPHSESASPPTQVALGAHSGSSTSTGSRHSSRTTSPAITSPGTATKLTNNGITVTPASPTTISPPPNPILSPISDCSPRGSPRTPVNSVIQRAPNSVSPAASAGSGSPSPGMNNNGPQQNVNFAIPRAPIPVRPNNNGVGFNPNAERPDRPPTIDLTDDDILMHNAHMRATGGGVVTDEQIQNHEAYQRRVAGIPGTSQFSNRPQSANQLKSVSCPHCNVFFGSVESMHEHKLRAHGHGPPQLTGPTNAPHQFRQPTGPQLAIRRQSPQPASLLNPNILRGDLPIRAPPRLPPPPAHQLMLRGQNHPQPRAQDVVAQRPRSLGGEAERFVIPLLNISRLEPAKLRALNDLGVMSLIPLQGITRLGIPIMRLRSDVSLGHFPHDSALEIGPIQLLESALGGGPSVTTSTSPHNVSPGASRPPMGSPPNNMNCGVCTDASCPEYHHHQVQRPTGNNPINMHGNGPVAHSNNVVAIPSNNNNNNQNQYHQSIRDPIIGNHGQLIVTPVSRQ